MNEKIDDGGRAFPRAASEGQIFIEGSVKNLDIAPQAGMSLRDWYAGQALRGLVTTGIAPTDGVIAGWSVLSFKISDAMIAEKRREEK